MKIWFDLSLIKAGVEPTVSFSHNFHHSYSSSTSEPWFLRPYLLVAASPTWWAINPKKRLTTPCRPWSYLRLGRLPSTSRLLLYSPSEWRTKLGKRSKKDLPSKPRRMELLVAEIRIIIKKNNSMSSTETHNLKLVCQILKIHCFFSRMFRRRRRVDVRRGEIFISFRHIDWMVKGLLFLAWACLWAYCVFLYIWWEERCLWKKRFRTDKMWQICEGIYIDVHMYYLYIRGLILIVFFSYMTLLFRFFQ